MAKFCIKCGKEIPDGIAFCTECGTKLEVNEPKLASAPSPVTRTPTVADNQNKVISTGLYMGLMILFAVPVIGFIACIIMAFAAKNKSIKNYARATLIWMIITFVLLAILFVIASVLANTLTDYTNQMTDGQFGDLGDFFSEFNNIVDSMDEIGNITNQLQNGDLSGLPIE